MRSHRNPRTWSRAISRFMRLVTTKGAVKWTCGTVRCFTDDDEDPAIVLTTGKIPEYDGYELVCRIRPIPDVVQMTLNDDGEVMA